MKLEGAGAALRKTLPGLLLAVAVMLVSLLISQALGGLFRAGQGGSPISAASVAVVLGMLICNVVPLSPRLVPGIQLAVKRLLRLGIVCVGIKLSLSDIVGAGASGIPVVLLAIIAGLVFVTWFNRALGLPRRLGTLIAAGTSICGVTAIVSTAAAIEADDREVAYAVANITLFGLLGMLLYPYLAHALLASPVAVGHFLGTAIHDTSQVVGAALTYREVYRDETAFEVATITKLTRNLFLIGVVPLLAYLHLRGAKTGKAMSWRTLLPLFVLGFLAMALVRTAGDATLARSGAALGLFDAATWKAVTHQIGDVWGAKHLLATALAGVGLQTRFSVFKDVGFLPFLVGFAGAAFVALVGFALASFLG